MTSIYSLKKNKVDVWLCDGHFFKNKLDDFFSILSQSEQQRAKRFKFIEHQQRFILSHGFKRTILAQYLNLDPAQVQFYSGAKGKPFVSNKVTGKTNFDNLNIQFNISHTDNLTLLAVTKENQLGIDIESMHRKTDWKSIVKRFFTPSEQELLFSLNKSTQEASFYQLWTRKEAYMKVLGSGLSLAPTEFTLSVPPQYPELIAHHSDKYQAAAEIFFRPIDLTHSYKASYKSYCATLASTGVISDCSFYNFKS